jgi:hypothetical protein
MHDKRDRVEYERKNEKATQYQGGIMYLSYPGLSRHEKLFQRWSGLSVTEFNELYRRFEAAWEQAEVARLQSRVRQRALGGGGDYQLDLDTRLLMVLIWLRHYLTGETLGFLFGVNQSTASRTIARILPVLQQLEQANIQWPPPPWRRLSFGDFKQAQPDLFAIFDATEQSVNKPQDDTQARLYFSGKQRRPTCKVAIHVNENNLIRQISPTAPGSIHDVTHLRQSGLLTTLPPDTIAVADAAFVGIYKDLPQHNVLVPYKAYRKHPLVAEQIYANRFLSSIRIKVENVFAHLKNFRILSHRFRHNVATVHAQVFTILASFHNRRILHRLRQAWLAA